MLAWEATMMASQSTEPAPHAEPAPHRDLWPGIAGLTAAALLITGHVLWMRTPDIEGRGAIRRVVLFYAKDSNRDLSEAATLILLAAGLLFLFFLVALSRLAGNRSHLVLVGGTVFTVFLMVAALAGNIFAIAVNHSDVVPATSLAAILLLHVAYGAMVAAMAGAAVMLFAIWRAAQETRAVPAWLGWAGFVVAVLSLAGPVSAWFTPLLLALWTLWAGVLLILNARVREGEGRAT
jgi:hypothetical protein